jgi:uncharacterized protein YggT (Ycf19 family)
MLFFGIGIAHFLVHLFFSFLIVCLFARVIISWIPVGVENPIVRFFINITAPMLEPVQKRLPRMVVWMFDMNLMIAFFFVWWVIGRLDGIIQYGLPDNW